MSEKQSRGKKRPKSYYLKCAHKKVKRGHNLDANMRGFLVTCNGNEKQAVREMYNLLNEYSDKLYGPEVNPAAKNEETDGSDSEEDIEAAMKKEVDSMKDVKPAERRFQNTNTKSRNTLFIKTTLEDPSTLAHTIMSDIYSSGIQKSRFAIRMLPIASTCKCRINDIEVLGKTLLKKYFETPSGTGLSYTTIFTKRNNTEISRDAVIPKLGQIVKDLNPLHRVNHVNPDFFILVEIIGTVCCISIVKDFFKFKKYNLIEVSKQKEIELQKQTDCENHSEEKEERECKIEDSLTNIDTELLMAKSSEQSGEDSECSDNTEAKKPCLQKKNSEEKRDISYVGKTGNLSREATVIMENAAENATVNHLVKNQTIVMESLDMPDTVVMPSLNKTETVMMESLPRSETVVMENLDRNESVMDALSRGESVMDMATVSKEESVMEVLTKEESVMDSYSTFL